jgi:hypothetical protein
MLQSVNSSNNMPLLQELVLRDGNRSPNYQKMKTFSVFDSESSLYFLHTMLVLSQNVVYME